MEFSCSLDEIKNLVASNNSVVSKDLVEVKDLIGVKNLVNNSVEFKDDIKECYQVTCGT